MPQPPDVRYRKSANHVTRTIAEETIVVPIRSDAAELDSIFVLNEVAAAIWALLDHESQLEPIVAELARRFEVAPAAARGDAERFLAELRDCGLVAEVSAT